MKDEYTFVMLDNDLLTTGDAVFVDIDNSMDVDMDFVTIDDAFDSNIDVDSSIFISMDDTDMMSDFDIDSYSSDINDADVSMVL
jgi:hypothetical protein